MILENNYPSFQDVKNAKNLYQELIDPSD